jgi:two-component system, sensor histidine kinase RegB
VLRSAVPRRDRPPIPERNWVNIQWLARLRWAQIAGQSLTVLVGQFVLDGKLPITWLLAVISIGLVSNLGVELYFFGDRNAGQRTQSREVHEWHIAMLMMLDVAVLTGLLYLTGGPHNPFGILYVVQIALATVLLHARWPWILTGLSFIGFGILLVAHRPLVIPEDNRGVGVWVALGVASAFVVHFLLRITASLAEREAELTEARGLAARQERLASLTTMAAGAAHELSTPLGTVALAAKELERALAKIDDPRIPDLAADARLIREQVGRCRGILDQIQQGAGTVGENVEPCAVSELLDETMVGIRPTPTVHRDVPAGVGEARLRLPPRAVSQALRSLVTNAQDASPANSTVVVSARNQDGTLSITIRDRGVGIPAEVLARIGEPFYTTKAPGRGMGLGLFLARAVIEGVGGTLEISSAAGQGTEVSVRLPMDVSPPSVSAIRRTRQGVARRSGELKVPEVKAENLVSRDETNKPSMVSKPG